MAVNGASIGTGLACVGVVATGVLSAYAMKKYLETDIYPGEERKEFLKCFAIPMVVGAATIGTFCAVRHYDKQAIAGLGASVAALSSRLNDTQMAIKEEYGEEGKKKIAENVAKKIFNDDLSDVVVLDPDGAIFVDTVSKLKIKAYSETILNGAFKVNRNYQIRGGNLFGGFASLWELYRLMGIKKKDLIDRDLNWTKYIGWHSNFLDMDGFAFIDFTTGDSEDCEGVKAIYYETPVMPICINPPDIVHMICHTDSMDLSDLELDRDDVETEISVQIRDDAVE